MEYDLIVIGGGAAGFVAAKMATGLGKNVAIVEKRSLGGDCTWYGCTPSKALLKVAQLAFDCGETRKYRLRDCKSGCFEGPVVMDHVRKIRESIYNGHLPESFEAAGIKIISGSPEFLDNHQIKVGDEIFKSKKFILCMGSRAFIPSIEGIDKTPFHTNETIFEIKSIPKSMIILGGGPIGTEMATAFSRLGVEITVIEKSRHILIREDNDMAEGLMKCMSEEGVKFETHSRAIKFAKDGDSVVVTIEKEDGLYKDLKAEAVLVAVGRRPNIEGLALANAGVEISNRGVVVDKYLKTTTKNIFAAGDIVGPYLFSHIAEYHAVTAVRNMFLPFKKKVDHSHMIWSTFSDPELAHAGMTEEEARAKFGDIIKIFKVEFKNIDRSKTDANTLGWAKFILDKKYKILGAHILGNHAGELIHEAQILKSLGIPFTKLATIIHAYPTLTDVSRQAAKLAYIDKIQNNWVVKLVKKFR